MGLFHQDLKKAHDKQMEPFRLINENNFQHVPQYQSNFPERPQGNRFHSRNYLLLTLKKNGVDRDLNHKQISFSTFQLCNF